MPSTPAPSLHPALRGFSCLRCEARQPVADVFTGCPTCAEEGHASSVIADYDVDTAPTDRLPMQGAPSLGEGDTPLLPLDDIARELDLDAIWIKAEGQNPTGSHKDRMSAQLVARAVQAGAERVLCASSGNAGVSIAAYAARNGLDATIFTVEGIGQPYIHAITAFGAEIIQVKTGMERWRQMARWVQEGRGYPATNYSVPVVGSNPFGVQGYKTVGYELALDLAETPPDVILVPTARGDLLWGIWQGLQDAWSRHPDPQWPRMVAVDPFERTAKVLAGADYRGHFSGSTTQGAVASKTVTLQTVHALEASKGLAIDVGDEDARACQIDLLHQGIPLEACSAAPLAALRRLRGSGDLPAGSRAVLIGSSDGRREPIP